MYTIKVACDQRIEGTNRFAQVVKTLDRDNEFCIATNQPMQFFSPQSASNYYCKPNSAVREPLCSMPFIKGPQGGKYHILTGQYWR